MNPRQPVILSCTPEGLVIDCFFVYNRRAQRALSKKAPDPTPARDLFERAVREHWSGSYRFDRRLKEAYRAFCAKTGSSNTFEGAAFLPVKVVVTRYPESRLSPVLACLQSYLRRQRRPARIYFRRSLFLPSHAASPLHRRLWGIFRTGHLESIGLNWSPAYPGYLTIATATPPHRLPGVAAHEAGHLFGLGDAYAAWYRFFSEAPGTQGYMMRDTSKVQVSEIAMMLEAHTAGTMRYFPRTFQLRDVGKGLYRALLHPLVALFKKP